MDSHTEGVSQGAPNLVPKASALRPPSLSQRGPLLLQLCRMKAEPWRRLAVLINTVTQASVLVTHTRPQLDFVSRQKTSGQTNL